MDVAVAATGVIRGEVRHVRTTLCSGRRRTPQLGVKGGNHVSDSTSHARSAHAAKPSRAGFVRTVVGDLPATSALGVCDAHEHVATQGPWLAENLTEFVLDDLDRTLVDLRAYRAAGGGWIVDAMPTGAGRDAARLAQVAQQSGVPVVCSTGVHQSRFYPSQHPLLTCERQQLLELFVREIMDGVDDGAGPLGVRAGAIKVACDGERLSWHEQERFIAAAQAQRHTSCAILTHTAGGREAYEQVAVLLGNGATLSQVVLSHCDVNPDLAYHRELLSAGVCLEYDQHFRQISRGDGAIAIDLIVELVGEFPDQILLGMNMARRGYWRGYGGRPGLAWLQTDLLPMLRRSGVSDRQLAGISVENAVRAFALRLPISKEHGE
jgi:5-phospho-D-xylono-1,4-lactonase